MGSSSFLLVFLGVWHATEFIMDRGSSGARKLIPTGILFLALGVLIALGLASPLLAAVSLGAVLGSLGYLLINRKGVDIRRWVLFASVAIQSVLVFVLVRYLIATF